MKTYYQNGTMAELEYIINDKDTFAIQHDIKNGRSVIFYPGDNLIRELRSELVHLADKFVSLYFPDLASRALFHTLVPTSFTCSVMPSSASTLLAATATP